MKTGIAPSTYDFLAKLKKNNNREWFNANKKLYEAALADFTEFTAALIEGLSKFDKHVKGLDARRSIFRIYRDTRFSKDKFPYKTHFATRLHRAGGANVAGFYFSASPDEVWMGGGLYAPEPDHLNRIRKHISKNAKRFLKIVNNPTFRKNFGGLWDEDKLKTAPKGFDKADPMVEYLKHKHFVAGHDVPKSLAASPKLLAHSLKVAKLLVPFHEFLNEA